MATWSITQLQTYPEAQGQTNFVCSASWNVSDADGEFTGSLNGATAFKLDPEAPFVPYDQLTESQVLAWVFASIGEEGKASAEADVDAQIAYAKEQIQTPTLPWSA
jgi:hypothetical protein